MVGVPVVAEEEVLVVEVLEAEALEVVVVEAVLNLRQGEPHIVQVVAVSEDLRFPVVAVVIPVTAVVMDLEEEVLEEAVVEEVSR